MWGSPAKCVIHKTTSMDGLQRAKREWKEFKIHYEKGDWLSSRRLLIYRSERPELKQVVPGTSRHRAQIIEVCGDPACCFIDESYIRARAIELAKKVVKV